VPKPKEAEGHRTPVREALRPVALHDTWHSCCVQHPWASAAEATHPRRPAQGADRRPGRVERRPHALPIVRTRDPLEVKRTDAAMAGLVGVSSREEQYPGRFRPLEVSSNGRKCGEEGDRRRCGSGRREPSPPGPDAPFLGSQASERPDRQRWARETSRGQGVVG
jgi:hypothetical protein